ncbi:MAG: GAF domain-containing protein [Chloroflexi bacterium]|nr:GAF domain-containing protein [Chloroflexota bacterium]
MKNQRITHFNRYEAIAIFLVLTLLAMGDMLEIIPYFAPVVANPLFPFFHESHDLLALMVALYAAHKLSPAAGWGALAWFFIVHIPYAYMVFPNALPELFRLATVIAAAIIGIRIIAIRSRLERQLEEPASDLEIQRAAALQRADELTILNGIAIVGVEATNVDTLIENAAQILKDALHPDYFDIGMVEESSDMLRVYNSTLTANSERLMLPLGKGVTGQVIATGKSIRVPDVRLEPAYLAVNPEVLSELCVPLKVSEKVIGLINIESKHLDAFSEADEYLMTTFAGQLVNAIEKVRLFQLAHRHAQRST